MRKFLSLAALVVALATPAAAQAETYDASRLNTGVYVCPMTYGLLTSGSYTGAKAQTSCPTFVGPIETRCDSALYQNGGLVATASHPNTYACQANAWQLFCWCNYQANATVRVDLSRTGYLWSASPGFYSGNQDGATWYTCEIGPDRKVKKCNFYDRDF